MISTPGSDTGGMLPFEGSAEICKIVADLFLKWEVTTFVETGTQRGATASWANCRVHRVVTIESDKDRFLESFENLKNSGVIVYLGPSEELLELIHFKNEETILFFLDAHSMQGTPIVAELRAIGHLIKKFSITPILCIHDIEVPGKPELGFDHYEDGTVLNLDRIKPALSELGMDDWNIGFNSIPDGAARGFCYITPKP